MEYFDIYDKDGVFTGKKVMHDYVLQKGEYRGLAHLCIFNSKGQMLIQKRGVDKIDWPGCWDISCGGGVNSGETTFQAAKRECKEELGIDVDFDSRPIFRAFYPKGFDDYYTVYLDLALEELLVRQGEVLGVEWAELEEILSMMKNGKFVNYNPGFIELLFSMSKNRGTYLKK